MAYPMSLQQHFDYLYRTLNSSVTEFQYYYDGVIENGVDAQTQRAFADKVNVLLSIVEDSIGIDELVPYWVEHKPSSPAYDLTPDLTQLESDLKSFNQLVFEGTPTDNDYIKDTYILLDGLKQSEYTTPYDGPSIISYEFRHYTAGQATAYADALYAVIVTLNTILSS